MATDTERLDWLEKHCSVSFRWKAGWVQGPVLLREAIDAAMAPQIETKVYPDGVTATGTPPLPEKSPLAE